MYFLTNISSRPLDNTFDVTLFPIYAYENSWCPWAKQQKGDMTWQLSVIGLPIPDILKVMQLFWSTNLVEQLFAPVHSKHDDVIKWKHFPHHWPFVRVTGHRWIPCTKASDAELWCFLWSAPEPTVEETMETPVISDAIALIITSL